MSEKQKERTSPAAQLGWLRVQLSSNSLNTRESLLAQDSGLIPRPGRQGAKRALVWRKESRHDDRRNISLVTKRLRISSGENWLRKKVPGILRVSISLHLEIFSLKTFFFFLVCYLLTTETNFCSYNQEIHFYVRSWKYIFILCSQ